MFDLGAACLERLFGQRSVRGGVVSDDPSLLPRVSPIIGAASTNGTMEDVSLHLPSANGGVLGPSFT